MRSACVLNFTRRAGYEGGGTLRRGAEGSERVSNRPSWVAKPQHALSKQKASASSSKHQTALSYLLPLLFLLSAFLGFCAAAARVRHARIRRGQTFDQCRPTSRRSGGTVDHRPPCAFIRGRCASREHRVQLVVVVVVVVVDGQLFLATAAGRRSGRCECRRASTFRGKQGESCRV